MPAALTRQHSASQKSATKSTKRPGSPIKRSSSARLSSHGGRSPSPFSPNTSHNEMPTPSLANADSTTVLKPAVPIRRRSARLSTPATSKAAAASNPANGVNDMPSSLSQSISLNGVPLLPKDSIQELDEPKDAWSSAVPNGHAHVQATEPAPYGLNELKPVIESPPAPEATEPVIAKEVVRPAVATEPVKVKIDWEIPRKTLHSSIGLYSFYLSYILFG